MSGMSVVTNAFSATVMVKTSSIAVLITAGLASSLARFSCMCCDNCSHSTATSAPLDSMGTKVSVQAYSETSELTLEVFGDYAFINAADFEARHGVKLQNCPELSQHVIEIPNELNKMEKGLLMQAGDGTKTLRVCNRVGSFFSTQLHDPTKQVRAGQADTLRGLLDEKMLKERPKGLSGPRSSHKANA